MDSFTRINQSVYIRTPPKNIQNGLIDSNGTTPPTTILFFAWMGALPRHYAKFLAYYSQMYPDARIVLVVSTPLDVFIRSYAAQQRRLEPIVDAIRADSGGRLLAHLLSNGGANAFSNLLLVYKRKTGQMLPVQAVIFDSAPGQAGVRTGINAMKYSLPTHPVLKYIFWLLAFSLLVFLRLTARIFCLENFIQKARRLLNDPQTTTLDSNRCYIYSKTDKLIDWQHVEDHGIEAKRHGYKVSMDLFSGSAHVSHMRTDPERYWRIVQRVWKSTNIQN